MNRYDQHRGALKPALTRPDVFAYSRRAQRAHVLSIPPILMSIGVLMVTGQLERLAYWLLATFPAPGTIG